MTIAAGFLCMDGIILAADTQETIPGYTKNSTEKIRFYDDQGLGIAITGAGDTDLIETVGAEIERALCGHYAPRAARFPEEVKEIIQQTVASAFQKYISPYSSFPRDERPSYELLILYSVKNEVNEYESLFKVSGTIVREISYGAECIGSGLILAKSLIERFYDPFMEMDQAILSVCYVMHQTKKWVDGCGGKTDLLISSVKNGIHTSIGSRDIDLLEDHFETCEGAVNTLIVDLMNPNVSLDQKDKLYALARKHAAEAVESIEKEADRMAHILRKFSTDAKKSKPQKSENRVVD